MVSPEQSIGFALEQLKRILEVFGEHPLYILCPIPIYFTFPCCREPTHMVNSGKPDFFLTLLRELQRLGASIRRLLAGPTIIDTMELVCGQNYTEQQAESTCRAGWAMDAVHPTARTFDKMALNLMEKITPGVRGRETPRPLQPTPLPPTPPATPSSSVASTSPGRKRARCETSAPSQRTTDRSTERSRKWPVLREQRRAATYDVEFFNTSAPAGRRPGSRNTEASRLRRRLTRGAGRLTTASHRRSITPHESTWEGGDAGSEAAVEGAGAAESKNGTEVKKYSCADLAMENITLFVTRFQ